MSRSNFKIRILQAQMRVVAVRWEQSRSSRKIWRPRHQKILRIRRKGYYKREMKHQL